MNINVEPACDFTAQLGEGVLWDQHAQLLYWVDITGKKLLIFNPETQTNSIFDLPQQVGTVVVTDRGTVLVAMESEIAELDPRDGTLVKRLDIEPHLDTNRCNDGKCDPAGRFWVGTMSMIKAPRAGALYRIDSRLEPVGMIEQVTTSNGIVWNRDSTVMYYIDTGTRRVDAFDFDLSAGTVENRRTVFALDHSLGAPDGMAIDAEGLLWVALFGGSAVIRIDPDQGVLTDRIEIPAPNVTSVAFGGADMSTLYITTASIAMSDTDRERFPLAGKLFRCCPGVKGTESFRFRFS